MRRGDFIPVGKTKKIIYLERRGRKKKSALNKFLSVLGVLCLLYCMSIALFMGYGSSFFLIWAVIGVGCLGLSWLLSHKQWMNRVPVWFKRGFQLCVVLGLLFLGVVEGMVFAQFGAKAEPAADFVIILGAQWKQEGPSYVLQKRLDKALEYLHANPSTQVIVSGGQGTNEPISEAQGMKEYLTTAGIQEERIIMEDQSTSTCENLVFSSNFLNAGEDRVVLVTNNFHVFRATSIARKQGYARIEGLAAGSYPGMLPNNLLREFFGVVKDCLVGNM